MDNTTIAQELERIISAKAAIKKSIEGKGVVVPDDATIDQYFAYIDKI